MSYCSDCARLLSERDAALDTLRKIAVIEERRVQAGRHATANKVLTIIRAFNVQRERARYAGKGAIS